MARYRVLTWHGIPAQVKAHDEAGRRASRALPDWFQHEIDRVAMREGLVGTDAYLDGWVWSDDVELPGDATEAAEHVVRELATRWGRDG